MKRKLLSVVALAFVVAALAACGGKTPHPEQAKGDSAVTGDTRSTTSQQAEKGDGIIRTRPSQFTGEALAAKNRFENEDVYFNYDSSELDGAAMEVLRAKAGWLKINQWAEIVIEGHCDERGTAEYNLALGERRAESARKFLSTSGIAGDRLNTVSYGEERPVVTGHDESAWSKNRRAHFVIK